MKGVIWSFMPVIIGIILAIICIANLGFNVFGCVIAFIALSAPAVFVAEGNKNKANRYLAEKYDEKHKLK